MESRKANVRFGCRAVVALACMSLAQGAWAKDKIATFLPKSDAWFASSDARQVADNVLTYQSELGGWPKNVSTATQPFDGERAEIKPTFDNGATTDELRFLARAFTATGDVRYKAAFERGLDYILKAQYDNGGWPQTYPPGKAYYRRITFNDNAMIRLMEFLREVSSNAAPPGNAEARPPYAFLDAPRRQAARRAFDRGVQCILKCQIKVDGKLTAWCAQHDEVDLSPRSARTYEPASLSGAESVGIVRLLMSLDNPAPEVVQAVEAAARWLEAVKIKGIRVEVRVDRSQPHGKAHDKFVVTDPSAPPLWARFYEVGTNKPLFTDRDGKPRASIADIGYERRNGYSWLGAWPQTLLEKDYPAWKKKVRP